MLAIQITQILLNLSAKMINKKTIFLMIRVYDYTVFDIYYKNYKHMRTKNIVSLYK